MSAQKSARIPATCPLPRASSQYFCISATALTTARNNRRVLGPILHFPVLSSKERKKQIPVKQEKAGNPLAFSVQVVVIATGISTITCAHWAGFVRRQVTQYLQFQLAVKVIFLLKTTGVALKTPKLLFLNSLI